MHPSQVKSGGVIPRAQSLAWIVPEGGEAISDRPFLAGGVFETDAPAFGLAPRNPLQVAREPGHATIRSF